MPVDTAPSDVIRLIIEEVVKECRPAKVILFGSYAKGKQTKDSDIDLLVITEERMSLDDIRRMKKALSAKFGLPIQLICLTKKEFAETKDVIGGIAYPAHKYGETVYEEP